MALVERFAACGLSRIQAVRVAQWCGAMRDHLAVGHEALVEGMCEGLVGSKEYTHVGPWLTAHVTGVGRKKPSPRQRGCADVIPTLTAKPFWDPADLSITQSTITSLTAAAHEDLHAVQRQAGPFQPYRNPLDMCEPGSEADDLGGMATTQGHWNVSYMDLGEGEGGIGGHFEQSLRVVQQNIPRGFGHTFMSCLAPQTVVRPHYGPTNKKLRLYLPVVTSGDCALEVGGTVQPLTQGALLVFDDSFLHSAWNNTAASRFVLITDIWHPDLSEREVALLSLMHAAHERLVKTQRENPYSVMKTARGHTPPVPQLWAGWPSV